MSPYRSSSSIDNYNNNFILTPAMLLAIPFTWVAKYHRMDRFSYINLRTSGYLIEDKNSYIVGLKFKQVTFFYSSFIELRNDIYRKLNIKPLMRQCMYLRKTDTPVHLGTYSDGKFIQLACDDSWVEPKWGTDDDKKTIDPDVHVADDNRLYTFVIEKTTCNKCKE